MKYIFSVLFSLILFFSQGEAQFNLTDTINSACDGLNKDQCKILVCFEEKPLSSLPGFNYEDFCKNQEDSEKAEKAVVNQLWKIINTITLLAGAVAVLMISISGFRMITSLGGEDLEKAKQGLTWAIVALLIIIFSYVIVSTFINSIYEIGGGIEEASPEDEGFVGDGTDV